MPADFNRIVTSLRQEAFGLKPEAQRDLQLSNQVDWAFAVLFGRCGNLQVPLECQAGGALKAGLVDTAGTNELKVDATNALYAGIWKGADQATVSVPAGLATDKPGLYVFDYYAKELYTILADVYDVSNHWLRTYQAPP